MHMVLLADLLIEFQRAHRDIIRIPAVGEPAAGDELVSVRLTFPDDQRAAAQWTWPDLAVSRRPAAEHPPDLGTMGLQLVEDLLQHLPGLAEDDVFLHLAAGDTVHILLQAAGH